MNLGYTSLMNRLLSWIIISDADALSNVLLHFNSTKYYKYHKICFKAGKFKQFLMLKNETFEVIFFAS